MLIDTHCHIHESDYPLDSNEVIKNAHEKSVDKFICVGTSLKSSREAIAFAKQHTEAYATIGVHPHDTKDGWEELEHILDSSVIAIGEVGLDYYYTHSPRDTQIQALKWQIELALRRDLPIIFHVREAFDDFWPVFDSYKGIRGELHSFTDNRVNLEAALERGLYIGVNGISTFTKNESQRQVFASIPLDRLLLETDAPFLTPAPYRGKVNEPSHIHTIAQFHAGLRGTSLEEIAKATSANAQNLFGL